jgi:pimeloyl-ACP methyl ester carboxylesterase
MLHAQSFDHQSGQFIKVNDAEIYIEERGTPDAPVLLMLHGGFGSMEDFNAIVPRLAPQFRLIGVDSRGHGRSTLGTLPLTYAQLTTDLVHVTEVLQLQEFNVLGYSDGGIVAYRLAAQHEPRLRRIVTVGAPWEMSRDDPSWEFISGMTPGLWRSNSPEIYDSYMKLNPRPEFERFANAVIALWTDLSSAGYPQGSVTDIKNELLVIRGDQDPFTFLESMTRLKQVLPRVNFLNIPFAGHQAFREAPECFLWAMDAFFHA